MIADATMGDLTRVKMKQKTKGYKPTIVNDNYTKQLKNID